MNDQNKIIIIAGVLIVSLIGLFITIMLGFGFLKNKSPELDGAPISITEEFPIIDTETSFEDEKEPVVEDLEKQYDSITGNSTEPLTNDIVKTLELNTHVRISSMNFVEALSYLTNEIGKYSIPENSDVFKPLEDLLRDLSKMAQIHYSIESGDEAMAVEIISSLEQPNNHLLATLSLKRTLREAVIQNEDSLNPIFEGGVILDVPTLEKTYGIRTSYNILEVAKVPFQIEDNRLIADYLYTTEGLILYKIHEEEENSTRYMTIKRWRELMPTNENRVNNGLDEAPETINEEVKNEN